MCGFGFERGKRYLLFTHEAEGTLSVSSCSRSKPSSDAAEDIALLDRLPDGGASQPVDAAAPPASSGPTPPALEAGAVTAPEPPPRTSDTSPPELAEPHGSRAGCAGCGVPASSSDRTAPLAAGLGVLLLFVCRHSRERAHQRT